VISGRARSSQFPATPDRGKPGKTFDQRGCGGMARDAPQVDAAVSGCSSVRGRQLARSSAVPGAAAHQPALRRECVLPGRDRSGNNSGAAMSKAASHMADGYSRARARANIGACASAHLRSGPAPKYESPVFMGGGRADSIPILCIKPAQAAAGPRPLQGKDFPGPSTSRPIAKGPGRRSGR